MPDGSTLWCDARPSGFFYVPDRFLSKYMSPRRFKTFMAARDSTAPVVSKIGFGWIIYFPRPKIGTIEFETLFPIGGGLKITRWTEFVGTRMFLVVGCIQSNFSGNFNEEKSRHLAERKWDFLVRLLEGHCVSFEDYIEALFLGFMSFDQYFGGHMLQEAFGFESVKEGKSVDTKITCDAVRSHLLCLMGLTNN